MGPPPRDLGPELAGPCDAEEQLPGRLARALSCASAHMTRGPGGFRLGQYCVLIALKDGRNYF